MKASETLNELGKALAAAQAEMENAAKDGKNPHFRSTYATLAAVREATIPVLARHGISVVQLPYNHGDEVGVETTLLHSSGQWMSASAHVKPSKMDAQGLGSAITYLRRYSLAAMAGISQEDDDGNAASTPRRDSRNEQRNERGTKGPVPVNDAPNTLTDAQVDDFKAKALAATTQDDLKAVYAEIQAACAGGPAGAKTGLNQLFGRCKRELEAAASLNIDVGSLRSAKEAIKAETGKEQVTKKEILAHLGLGEDNANYE